YLVSRAAGFGIVPPTVFRDGPFGPGMCQLWIDTDDSVDIIALSRRTDHAALRDMAVFDAVVNNADRKIGHLLPAPDGHLYGCDHGVCFAEEYKLRTVLWQWRGASLPGRSVEALQRLRLCFETGNLADDLGGMLTAGEITATRERLELLISHRVHPYPPEDWPAVPWPPV
ncbi:MAG: phosphatidylinositol kinase, partial [Streptosporangiaceae bacterium]